MIETDFVFISVLIEVLVNVDVGFVEMVNLLGFK